MVEGARLRGAASLTEGEAKELLRAYGVPVVEGGLAHDADEAVRAAEGLGFPVALKGIVPGVLHKSEAGLVLLGLDDDAAVRRGFALLERRGGGRLDGVLVERMVDGRREFVVGMTRDRQFGSVVMFGVGGVLTEALQDVVFAVPPLDDREAGDLLDSISRHRAAGAVPRRARGRQGSSGRHVAGGGTHGGGPPGDPGGGHQPAGPGRRPTGGRGCAGHPGEPAAEPAARPPVNVANLEAVCRPGAWPSSGPPTTPSAGAAPSSPTSSPAAIPAALSGGATRGDGVRAPAYPSVTALPEAPDLAIVAVPVQRVKGIVDECGRKGVRAVVVISAGFSEVGAEGAALQREVAEVAAGYGMAMIGPNCMGVVSSWSRFYAVGAAHVHTEPSPASIVSQSGNAGVQLMVSAQRRGAGLGKFVSIGNEGLFAIPDLLEFFRDDPEDRCGGRLHRGLRGRPRASGQRPPPDRSKPLVVLRGGTGELGRKAAASHTGAMAASQRVFEGVARQAA